MAPQCPDVSSQTRCCFEAPSAALHALHQATSRADGSLLPPLFSLCVLVYPAPRARARTSSFRRHYVNFCTLNGRLEGIAWCCLRPVQRLAHGTSTQPLGQQLGTSPAYVDLLALMSVPPHLLFSCHDFGSAYPVHLRAACWWFAPMPHPKSMTTLNGVFVRS